MIDWTELLATYKNTNVYAVCQDEGLDILEQTAVSLGMAFFKVDLVNVANKDDFLGSISKALKFPDYFGMNWDALEECLTDLAWCEAPGYVIELLPLDKFHEESPDELETARSIFNAAAEYWKAQNKPFFVILVGAQPLNIVPWL